MTVKRRAVISMWRQKGQTFVFMGIIFLISTLLFGVISVDQAISNTDQALRAQLPAVAILRGDEDTFWAEFEETGLWPERENLRIDLLNEIGNLPYVRSFNYTVQGHEFYSEILQRHWNADLFLQLADPIPNVPDQRALSFWYDIPLERFTLNGVGNPRIWEMEAEIITLINGRTFTEEEMAHELAVAVVSEQFLATNQLVLGDTFLLDQTHHDPSVEPDRWYNEYPAHMLTSQPFELEIVGVFEHELIITADSWAVDIQNHLEILNQIFVPSSFIASTVTLTNPEALARLEEAGSMINFLEFSNMYFLLNDPLDLAAFHESATDLLPLHWQLVDYSFIYADMARSMEMIERVAQQLFIGVSIAMVVVLVLLSLLLLQMRKVEMGIYLALGAHKKKIIGQLLLEVLIPAVVGISLSVFLGYLLASAISTEMLQNSLAESSQAVHGLGGIYEILGIRYELTLEEMLELYEVRLELSAIVITYVIILSSVLVATLTSTGLILRMNPKKVLLS